LCVCVCVCVPRGIKLVSAGGWGRGQGAARICKHADVRQCTMLASWARGARSFPFSLSPFPRRAPGSFSFRSCALGHTRPPCCLPLCLSSPSACHSPTRCTQSADKVPPTRHPAPNKASAQPHGISTKHVQALGLFPHLEASAGMRPHLKWPSPTPGWATTNECLRRSPGAHPYAKQPHQRACCTRAHWCSLRSVRACPPHLCLQRPQLHSVCIHAVRLLLKGGFHAAQQRGLHGGRGRGTQMSGQHVCPSRASWDTHGARAAPHTCAQGTSEADCGVQDLMPPVLCWVGHSSEPCGHTSTQKHDESRAPCAPSHFASTRPVCAGDPPGGQIKWTCPPWPCQITVIKLVVKWFGAQAPSQPTVA